MPVATALQLTGPRRGRSVAALLGIVALLLGTVGVHAHVAAEAHGRCEHGAEIHMARVVGTAWVATPGTDATRGTATLGDPTWIPEDGDHHCAANAPVMADAPQVVPTLVALPVEHRVVHVPPPRRAAAAALYRLAPKTSPPIVWI